MTFATSYYANISKIREKYPDYIIVSISGWLTPELENEVDYWDKRFAPNKDFFTEYKNSPEGKEREDIYVKKFKNEVLANRDLNSIFKEWSNKAGVMKKFVLLCYESNDINSSSFCHRRIVAEAIENKYGVEVPELFFDYNNYKIEDYKVKIKNEISEDEW